MYKRRAILAMALGLAASAVARGDNIQKIEGQAMGDVVAMTRHEVTVEQSGRRTAVPVNEIEVIRYTGEPALLSSARTAIDAGRYEDAVASLERIKAAEIERPEIRQDVQFYTALAKARIALASSDLKAVSEAGSLMAEFVSSNSNNYHYLEACELVGDMLVVAGKSALAQKYYGQLAEAPWPDFKMRADVALGRAFLAEGKPQDALASFEAALAVDAQGKSADQHRLAATLGKARCLAEAGRSDEAVKLLQGVIAKAHPEDVQLHARAYNALGLAHEKAGRTQDALLAYLHVTELYFAAPKQHIEALEKLVELWPRVQKPERADQAARILRERYNRSPRSN